MPPMTMAITVGISQEKPCSARGIMYMTLRRPSRLGATARMASPTLTIPAAATPNLYTPSLGIHLSTRPSTVSTMQMGYMMRKMGVT